MSFRCNSELDFIASLKHQNFYILQSAKFRSEQISKGLIANLVSLCKTTSSK